MREKRPFITSLHQQQQRRVQKNYPFIHMCRVSLVSISISTRREEEKFFFDSLSMKSSVDDYSFE